MTKEKLTINPGDEGKGPRWKRHVMLLSLLHSFGWHNPGFTINEMIGSLAMRANSLGDLISDRVAPSVSLAARLPLEWSIAKRQPLTSRASVVRA